MRRDGESRGMKRRRRSDSRLGSSSRAVVTLSFLVHGRPLLLALLAVSWSVTDTTAFAPCCVSSITRTANSRRQRPKCVSGEYASAFSFARLSTNEESSPQNRKNDSSDKSSNYNNFAGTSLQSSSLPTTSSSSPSSTNVPFVKKSAEITAASNPLAPQSAPPKRRKMELMWCGKDYCKDVIRERVVDEHVLLNGPATGQVAYYWEPDHDEEDDIIDGRVNRNGSRTTSSTTTNNNNGMKSKKKNNNLTRYVLLLIRQGDDELLRVAAKSIKAWTEDTTATPTTTTNNIKEKHGSYREQDEPDGSERNEHDDDCHHLEEDSTNTIWHDKIHVMVDPTTAARLEHNFGVRSDCIHLFEEKPTPGFGSHLGPLDGQHNRGDPWDPAVQESIPTTYGEVVPDLIVTLGGDGLLMHAGMLFQGPIPPILCVAGGSLGFLTPFTCDEMVDAVRIALGLRSRTSHPSLSGGGDGNGGTTGAVAAGELDNVFPPNMPSYPYDPLPKPNSNSFGAGGRICLSIRMRLCCQIMSREGLARARFNVLNEVVIDRGSSPYLAALECFCDDVHLTTVQADGIIFATPTGSTAYSMAAGGSVVHPAVPCILVTPICPHVLSFRSMVFPDHVVLRCYVPDDARSVASVAFDGKHRQELRRGESIQIRLSAYPVPTLNRYDHSSDWLGSLKQNFNFNARPRQRPLGK